MTNGNVAPPERPTQWRKILYETNNNFSDNYTPQECFLDAIERNKNLPTYSFQDCLSGACQLAIQVNLVVLFHVGYFALESKLISTSSLFLVVIAICVLSYAFLYIQFGIGLVKSLRRVLIYVFFGLGLSPMLYRLTSTIYTDTIHTTSGVMSVLHLITHNYGLTHEDISAFSLNAGLFSAVCLASRLPNSFDGFVLLSFSVEVLALLPIVRQRISDFKTKLIVTSVLSICGIIACTVVFSTSVALIFLLTLFALVFLCPTMFVSWQTYKNTIHGPWDEAVPRFVQR